jgi:hypothetical protein
LIYQSIDALPVFSDPDKRETNSKFVSLNIQPNPTSIERASDGNYWSRHISEIQVIFYHYRSDTWVKIKTYV